MLKMLIAIDGSAHARRLIDAVARLAPQIQGGVRVLLLNVAKPKLIYGDLPPLEDPAEERRLRRQQQQLLQAAAGDARAGGLKEVTPLTAQGEPASEILRVAQEQAVDQIVVGTHGQGQLSTLFLGSVVQRVLHDAPVPVLVVR